MTKITFTSYNVKGLNVPEKWIRLLAELGRLKSQIIFLQETHFRRDKIPSLKNHRFPIFPIVYHSAWQTSKSCGVSIILSKQLPWKESSVFTDEEGRFLIVKGSLGQQKVHIGEFISTK